MSGKAIKYIWVFDTNNRVYKDDDGNKTSSPNERHYWVKQEVVSETSQSWITNYRRKIPKNPTKRFESSVAFSEEEVEHMVWKENNAYKIADLVRRTGYKQLVEIADILGYVE